MYRQYILFGAITMGFMSLRWRRFKYAGMEHHEAPRDYNMVLHMVNDIVFGFTGFMAGQWFACDYTYKQRQYVLERIHFERQHDF